MVFDDQMMRMLLMLSATVMLIRMGIMMVMLILMTMVVMVTWVSASAMIVKTRQERACLSRAEEQL